MDAGLTAEQREIQRTLRELLGKRCGSAELRAAVETPAGYDPALWGALAGQLGLPGLALPEAYGGAGCGSLELALAGEELGRALTPSPLLATSVLAAPLITALGSAGQRAALLPRIAAGDLTATLAAPVEALALTCANDGDWAGGGRSGGVQARGGHHGWRLYGEVVRVLDGHSAGVLVVAAHCGGFARSRVRLFVVRGDAVGVTRVRHTALDATRPLGRVQLRDSPAELLGNSDIDVLPALASTGAAFAAHLACEAVGAAGRVLEMTVEHVKQREQFGRVIGSFQAVQHRLADVYVQVQAARSAAYYAAWAGGGQAVGGIALAQALDTLRLAAGEGIQLHGGIGFTWEHDAQLYFKRAVGDALLFGPPHRLRAYAADSAGVFGHGDGPGGEWNPRGSSRRHASRPEPRPDDSPHASGPEPRPDDSPHAPHPDHRDARQQEVTA
ncbi:acyl-CoA/acyl-ACP dehydrogenase [Streptomyces niveiscabiei]|uniref:acyl-CoA dehydrogenase family protein n=1 Tax=Streptomyces niveiscabiei TaxID=164115 RepID=UPI0029B0A7E4|nr:acyl-CoA dehydrogenase family protein [Streptomyces niveiscabiei]MDX3385475.1 acyl-CoA/acyl-ACP dehydrogenase [Streptomyces niveiscabiei]